LDNEKQIIDAERPELESLLETITGFGVSLAEDLWKVTTRNVLS